MSSSSASRASRGPDRGQRGPVGKSPNPLPDSAALNPGYCGGCSLFTPLHRLQGLPRPPPNERVEAPRSGAGEKQIEKNKAVEDRAVAAVDEGKERLRRVGHEIADRHFA